VTILGDFGKGGRPTRAAAAAIPGRILDAATALFLSDGYATTSMEAIAGLAGVSKRTLYARFPAKEVVLQAVVERLVEGWLGGFHAAPPGPEDLAATLTDAGGQILHTALLPEALALHRLLMAEAGRIPQLAELLARAGTGIGVSRIAAMLAQARIADPVWAAEQFLHLLLAGPQRRALGLGVTLTEAELTNWVARCVALFLHGTARA
jgi:TetR/AcrR family transcriptional repressor of mexJK operon